MSTIRDYFDALIPVGATGYLHTAPSAGNSCHPCTISSTRTARTFTAAVQQPHRHPGRRGAELEPGATQDCGLGPQSLTRRK